MPTVLLVLGEEKFFGRPVFLLLLFLFLLLLLA
jgi:hypothetical protein